MLKSLGFAVCGLWFVVCGWWFVVCGSLKGPGDNGAAVCLCVHREFRDHSVACRWGYSFKHSFYWRLYACCRYDCCCCCCCCCFCSRFLPAARVRGGLRVFHFTRCCCCCCWCCRWFSGWRLSVSPSCLCRWGPHLVH